MDYTIRVARKEDVERLLEIYEYYVQETAISFEYEVPSLSEFQKRYEMTIKRYPYLVVEDEGKVVGYAYAGLFKTRAAYAWSVETTIYMDKDFRGRGAGHVLYAELERYLKMQNILNLNACVTFANPESIQFHERQGYKLVAHFTKSGYKFKQWHDMVWLEKIIGEHRELMDDMIPFSKLMERNNMK